jgi:transposase-like protein
VSDIPKQKYTAEVKELPVKMVKVGKGIGPMARKLSLVEQTLRKWGKATERSQLYLASAKASPPAQIELPRLRAENVRLWIACEIIKELAVYFARSTRR